MSTAAYTLDSKNHREVIAAMDFLTVPTASVARSAVSRTDTPGQAH